MMGHVALAPLVNKLVRSQSQIKFGQYRDIIFSILATYNYEITLLSTTHHILEDDRYKSCSNLVSARRRGVAHRVLVCESCGRPLTTSRVRRFSNEGYAKHLLSFYVSFDVTLIFLVSFLMLH